MPKKQNFNKMYFIISIIRFVKKDNNDYKFLFRHMKLYKNNSVNINAFQMRHLFELCKEYENIFYFTNQK